MSGTKPQSVTTTLTTLTPGVDPLASCIIDVVTTVTEKKQKEVTQVTHTIPLACPVNTSELNDVLTSLSNYI